MATAAVSPSYAHSGASSQSGLWSWLTTVDHKRIGALYLYTSLAWFAVGGLEAEIMRWQLKRPNGQVVSAEVFNQLFTMHGTTMIFLVVMPLSAAFIFITTIINMRAPGMNLMRMPMFTWMAFVVQFLLILAFPVITIALVFLQFDRFFGTNFYTMTAGADPLLWQHLFWIFGHPEVYILILPAFGLTSEILPTFSRKPIFGYPVMVYSGILIAFLGFGVWAHHMFAVGMGPVADAVFATTTMLIAIPTGVKIFNWIFTMWGGNLRFTVAMKYAISLVALFVIGGISGVMHAWPRADLQQTDT